MTFSGDSKINQKVRYIKLPVGVWCPYGNNHEIDSKYPSFENWELEIGEMFDISLHGKD